MAEEIKVKRNTKDSVFADLFQDKKNLLKLYQALHPEDKDITEDELDIVTLDNVLTENLYNDLGLTVRGDKMLILTEAQATWTVNVIIRMLEYIAQSYREYFDKTGQSLYKSKPVIMPKPELYIIYVGERGSRPDIISLSKEFFNGMDIDIEVKAKVIYENDSEDIINQYIIFCKVFNEQRKLYGMTEFMLKETIRICKDRNILREYLISREKEVITIMTSLFDKERIMEIYAKDMAREAAKEAAKEAAEEAAKEATKKATNEVTKKNAALLLRKGRVSIDELAEFFPELSQDDIKELEEEVFQLK